MKQQIIIFLVITSIIFSLSLQPGRAQIISTNQLSEIETIIYGETREQDLIKRIEKLEQTLYGEKQSGALVERMDNIVNCVLRSEEEIPLTFLISTMEWLILDDMKQGPLLERIDRLEKSVFDEIREKPLINRANYFREIVLDDKEIPAEKITVPVQTPIRIKLLDKISSAEAQAGDSIEFIVVNDIAIDGKLVIPAGITGYFKVNKVQEAGNLGRDGNLELTMNDIVTMDGSKIALAFQREDEDGKVSRGLALGAGLLGAMVLSNPLGLVIGYFVKGQDEVIPAGEEIYVNTAVFAKVLGLKTELID